jgi:septal ring factor EnvC (AmiA/AmiB activator)
MVRLIATCLLFIFAAGGAVGQSASSKKKELQRLRSSIESTQRQINALSTKERSQKSSISSYEKKRHALTVFIKQMEDDLAALGDSATALSGQAQKTQQELEAVEKSYKKAAISLLKYKTEHKGIPESALTTDAVFQRMSRSLSAYRRQMIRLRDSLSIQHDLLREYSATQDSVLHTKSREQQQLSSTIAKSSSELKKIRSDKSKLNRQLEQKRSSVNKLRKLIERLVAEERRKAEAQRRKEEEARKKAGKPSKKRSTESSSVTGFARKSLPWPTSTKSILHGYGSYKNPTTGTTLDNPGIDIKASSGTTVKSVASGKVSSVKWLPGFNTLVIVDHGNGVRTVYANLATVNVAVGSSVEAGTKIGASGENIDGELVHFEVWNGRERQNPLTFLR